MSRRASRDASSAWSALVSMASPTRERLAAAQAARVDTVSIVREHMARVGLDPRALPPVVHVAGTKGKGSTAAMTEAILRAHGARTLTYTSPHLQSVRERFRVDCLPAPADAWAAAFWRVHDACVAPFVDAPAPGAPPHPRELSFFALLTVVCFELARAERVDALILEVGVGGISDATNAVATESVAATGVTTLDWDHTDVLGKSLNEIAAHKAGIFKRGVPAVTAPQRADAMARIRAVAALQGAPLIEATPSGLAERYGRAGGSHLGVGSLEHFPPLALDGAFQRTNAAVAVALAEVFLERAPNIVRAQEAAAKAAAAGAPNRDPPTLPSTTSVLLAAPVPSPPSDAARRPLTAPPPLSPRVLEGLRSAHWPGRAQVVALRGDGAPLAYLDGAHTDRSMRHAVEWFNGCVTRAAAAAPLVKHRTALVFNCPFEKDTLGLLIPLSTFAFDAAFITSVASTKRTLTPQPDVGAVLEGFLAWKRLLGDTDAVSALEDGIGGAPAPPLQSGASWQESLCALWTATHIDGRLGPLRKRIAHAVVEYGDEARVVIGPAATPRPLPLAAPPTIVCGGTDEVLAHVRARSDGGVGREQWHVLVTGSLYLVGEVLDRVTDQSQAAPAAKLRDRSVEATLNIIRGLQSPASAWMLPSRTAADVRETVTRALKCAGIAPTDVPPIIHVVGTKGKGSAAALTDGLLRACGLRTGLFTSPHLLSPAERFRVCGARVSDAVYTRAFSAVWDALDGDARKLPGFTLLTIVALRIFRDAGVDVAVLEAGVGGLLCATAALPEKAYAVTGLTQLGLEHVDLLGPTLTDIARQKAGAFKSGVPAIVASTLPEASTPVLRAVAAANKTPLWVTASPNAALGDTRLGLRGEFQRENASLAVSLVDAFLARAVTGDLYWPPWNAEGAARAASAASREGITLEAAKSLALAEAPGEPIPVLRLRFSMSQFFSEALSAVDSAVWPGRAHVMPDVGSRPAAFIDGAHTADSVRHALSWFLSEGGEDAALIFYCGPDKDAAGMLRALMSHNWSSVIVVAQQQQQKLSASPPPMSLDEFVATSQARAARTVDASTVNDAAHAAVAVRALQPPERASANADWPHILASLSDALAAKAGQSHNARVVSSVTEAFATAHASGAKRVLVVGSLYIVGEAIVAAGGKV